MNPLSANPTKWSNILKQFVGNLPTNCLSVFDHFVKLALKGLKVVENERSNFNNSKVFFLNVLHRARNFRKFCTGKCRFRIFFLKVNLKENLKK